VTTGYSSQVIPCQNTRAFKKHSIVICFDYDENILKNIWLNSPQQVDNSIYKTFLLSIATTYDFLLADWWKSIVVDIENPNEIDKYFEFE
jgi:type II restriction/modification system DNA methylase subunit YeeA